MGLNSVTVVSADEQAAKGQLTMSTSDNNIPAGTGMKFGKHLASVEKKVRDKTVKALRKWLSSRENMSELDMMKLWRGLFYCMWMSDKTPIQQELADNLAKMTHVFGSVNLSLLYLKCFFATMRKEWMGLDRYRLDKFYSLIRKVLYEAFVLLKKEGWEEDLVETVSGLVYEQVLSQPVVGLSFHLSDIFMDELYKASGGKLTTMGFNMLLEPFCGLIAETTDKPRLMRMEKNFKRDVLDKFTYANDSEAQTQEGDREGGSTGNKEERTNVTRASGKRELEDEGEESEEGATDDEEPEEEGQEEEEKLHFDVDLGELQDFVFTLAASVECTEGGRAVLYRIHRALQERTGRDFPEDMDESDADMEEDVESEGQMLLMDGDGEAEESSEEEEHAESMDTEKVEEKESEKEKRFLKKAQVTTEGQASVKKQKEDIKEGNNKRKRNESESETREESEESILPEGDRVKEEEQEKEDDAIAKKKMKRAEKKKRRLEAKRKAAEEKATQVESKENDTSKKENGEKESTGKKDVTSTEELRSKKQKMSTKSKNDLDSVTQGKGKGAEPAVDNELSHSTAEAKNQTKVQKASSRATDQGKIVSETREITPFPRCTDCGGFGKGLVKKSGRCRHCMRTVGSPSIDKVESDKKNSNSNREKDTTDTVEKVFVKGKKGKTMAFARCRICRGWGKGLVRENGCCSHCNRVGKNKAKGGSDGSKHGRKGGKTNQKKVKFGANKSLDYQESVKRLRSPVAPSTERKAPLKGLLKTEQRVAVKGTSASAKKQRRKAVDYF